MSGARYLKDNSAISALFLRHETKSEILFHNEGKDEAKCDLIGDWNLFEKQFPKCF
jgi:hypothetical protein